MSGDYSKKERHEMHVRTAAGYRKHCRGKGDGGMIIHQKKRTSAQIAADLDRRAEADDAVAAARAALAGALLARERILEETQEVYDAVRTMVRIAFGSSPQVLADFGLAPAKPRRRGTVEERLAAIEKAKTTRAARHPREDDAPRAADGPRTELHVVPVARSPAT